MGGSSHKRELRGLLEERRLGDVAELAARRRRVLGTLVSLTYDADVRVAWRAVEAMGVVAARLADEEPGAVRELLRRLMWLITEESGAICWRAPEAMAEIVARCPDSFGDYVPIVVHLLLETAEEDLAHFRAGILWAIGRLGPLAAPLVDEVLPAVRAALDHPDAQVRAMAVWCLGRIGRADVLVDRAELTSDEGGADVYEDGLLRRTTVARLTETALASRGSRPGR